MGDDDESLVHLSDAAHKLKSILSEEDIYNLISAERISKEFANDKISIRHLESILIQNIKNISPKIFVPRITIKYLLPMSRKEGREPFSL